MPFPPAMKVLLPILLYLALVFALGFVLALTAPRVNCEADPGDDKS